MFNIGCVQPLELEKFTYSLKRGPINIVHKTIWKWDWA